MLIISKNHLEFNKDDEVYNVVSDESNELMCPICLSALIKKGRRRRKLIQADESTIILSIQRLKCTVCKKHHHQLPDIIVPYKRHCTETIENIVSGATEDVCCFDCTIYKIKAWWILLQQYIKGVAASLSMKYNVNIASIQKVSEIVRMLANTHLWPRYLFGNDVRSEVG